MKYGRIGVVFLFLSLCLSGCGSSEDVTLDDEQNELIAQYAAGRILQNNPDYEQGYKDTEAKKQDNTEESTETTETATTTETASQSEEPTTTAVTESTTEATTETPSVTDLSDLFEKQKLQVNYKGVRIKSSYSDSSKVTSAVEAGNGKKLLIVELSVKNLSKTKNTVDMIESSVSYTLHTSEGDVEPMLTLLDNDFAVYQQSFDAGASKKAVLLFEVSKNVADSVDCTLDVTKDNKTDTIIIKK